MTDKYIKDGKVAVIVSLGYGAGWGTWNWEYPDIVFDPVLVKMILEHQQLDKGGQSTQLDNFFNRVETYANEKYPGAYLGGAWGLDIEWVPEGEKFRIQEYDGAESIILASEEKWLVA